MIKYTIMNTETGEYFKYFESNEPVWSNNIDEALVFEDKDDLVGKSLLDKIEKRFYKPVIKEFIN